MSELNLLSEEFCLRNSIPTDSVLQTVYRDTWVNTLYPQMLTNELQAKFLASVVQLSKPMRILEIGTFTGYSTISMARELPDGGQLITIEKNEELENRIRKNIALAHIENKVDLIFDNAVDILETMLAKTETKKFDLVYIDADKENYSNYLEKCYALLNIGGLLLADNVIWGGKMLTQIPKPDKETIGIGNFLNDVAKKEWASRMVLPIGDGLFWGVK
ncbi:MAG: methyltransferase [Bacteroidetes bacterium HGW-Bacteroidetes-6]|jgi:predicted O-methyltransferase YrrM|nr:MAG: methyltransferase [Bacteroidetes bacterium HGW-Bacteroidetes-6]